MTAARGSGTIARPSTPAIGTAMRMYCPAGTAQSRPIARNGVSSQ